MTFRDYAELVPGLFVGGHPEPEDPFGLGATVVVCLTDHSSVRHVPPGKLFVHWPIKDGPVPPEEPLRNLARLIDSCVRAGAVVYLHCQAGMNRSVLVAARVLIEQGMSAGEAIAHVRERRHGSLSDEYAAWLRAEDADGGGSRRGTARPAERPAP